MAQKIAVAVIHGVGKQDRSFAAKIEQELRRRFDRHTRSFGGNASDGLVVEPIYWAKVLQDPEQVLWSRIGARRALRFLRVRQWLIDFAADAVAYQPTPTDRHIYDAVHVVVARALARLADQAGPRAPLCVIAHSLGSVIASNYLYDLQVEPAKPLISDTVKREMGDSPLDRGETLTLFYTLASPIAIWSLRYHEYGVPIRVPSPHLTDYHPPLRGEWVNFYDKHDVIGYPLKPLNRLYEEVVRADQEVRVGGLLSGWNPLAHFAYWTAATVTEPIAKALAATWLAVNQESATLNGAH